MTRFLLILSFVFLSMPPAMAGAAPAVPGHAHHPKHNMVAFGTAELFVSHIVYVQPHNYQVILRLNLAAGDFAKYRDERARFPADRFIYLLDEMDISRIGGAAAVTGNLFRVDGSGARHDVLPGLRVERKNFEIVYFNELPLSLAAGG